jgi:drug/metabolite transporter (DMT)-like permease
MVLTGTINSVFNKNIQKLKSIDIPFEQHHWILTFGMFIGEAFSIFAYTYIIIQRRKQKAKIVVEENSDVPMIKSSEEEKETKTEVKPPVPTNFIFCISASCDLIASTIGNFGLTYLPTSVWQMMRGMELIFVCLWSKIFLKNHVYRHHLLGLGTLFFGLILIGLNAIINKDKDAKTAKNPAVGISLMVVGQLFSSTCYTLQEKFIHHYEVHPFQLVGFEGVSGVSMYLVLLIIFQFSSCDTWSDKLREGICFKNDKGKYHIEDSLFALKQFGQSAVITIHYICYIFSIALYNIVGINLTKLVSSTARAVIDTTRTVFIWAFFMAFHPIEGTEEHFYPVQFVGFLFLLAGSLLYNEIIEVPYLNLNYFTRKQIAARARKEEEENNQKENPERLYPNSITNNEKNTENTNEKDEDNEKQKNESEE